MLLVHVELHPCLADKSTRHQVPCRVDEREYDTQNIFIDIHDDQIPNGTTLELAAQYWPELSYLPPPSWEVRRFENIWFVSLVTSASSFICYHNGVSKLKIKGGIWIKACAGCRS
jgi:hypothetical protein